MDLDDQIASADPARNRAIGSPDSPRAREAYERIITQTAERGARRLPRSALLLAVSIALGMLGFGIDQLVPDASAPAGAAGLSTVAQHTLSQPFLNLGTNHYLQADYVASVSLKVTQIGNTRTPGVAASFPFKIATWVNGNGLVHQREVFGPPQFSNVAAQRAWSAAGLLGQSTSRMSHGAVVTYDQIPEFVALNVTHLSSDPKLLATALRSRKSGVRALDEMVRQFPGVTRNQLAFARAVRILEGPLIGAAPTLDRAVYSVLSTLRGIRPLGPTVDHRGHIGLGFTMPFGTSGGVTLIVNPTNGQLLELRNLDAAAPLEPDPTLGADLLAPYLPVSGTSAAPSAGSAILKAVVTWIDPILPTSIVPASSLPPALGR